MFAVVASVFSLLLLRCVVCRVLLLMLCLDCCWLCCYFVLSVLGFAVFCR